jgi:hypothetical protein
VAGAGVEHWLSMQRWLNGLSDSAEAGAARPSAAAAAMAVPRTIFVIIRFFLLRLESDLR